MPAILLVDDDENAWEAVRLALEPRVKVHAIGSLYGALNFLRTKSREVCGVIVDLNLTEGSDNFGRVLLERLREMGVPCVVFSGSIKSPADAQRYANEFGVLGTIGKGGSTAEGAYPLQQLRDSVDRMIEASLQDLRSRARSEIEHELSRREAEIEQERLRSLELVSETARVAGKSAAQKLKSSESARIQELSSRNKLLRTELIEKIDNAKTLEQLEHLRKEILHSLGAL